VFMIEDLRYSQIKAANAELQCKIFNYHPSHHYYLAFFVINTLKTANPVQLLQNADNVCHTAVP